MHNDFYRMIGSLQALSQYLLTRKPDGTARSTGSPPPANARTTATKLTSISMELLKAAFNFEVAENTFQMGWAQRYSALETAVANVYTNRTGACFMPVLVDNQGVVTLNGEYKRRFEMTRGGTGEQAQDFIDLMSSRLKRCSVASGHRTALTAVLNDLQTTLDRFLPAVDTVRAVFLTQATKFVAADGIVKTLLPGENGDLTRPWGRQDEQLQDMLKFMLDSANATVIGGPGDTSTPSWGSTGTSGSSSSSSGV